MSAMSGQVATRFGTYLQNVHDFDATAFGLSAGEAALMDPQQVSQQSECSALNYCPTVAAAAEVLSFC